MADVSWNLWHGCQKISPGCQNCYVFRMDARFQRDARLIRQTADFDLPVRKNRDGGFQVPAGARVFTCFTSDFFVPQADPWRKAAWAMIRMRPDLRFFWITKRPHRFFAELPEDWGMGWPQVSVYCTMENQDMADLRGPVYQSLPLAHKGIVCEPLLGPIDLRPYLGPGIEEVVVGGESGPAARLCRYEWVLSLRDQCRESGVAFQFKQTGALFEKEGRIYRIPRRKQHEQARLAKINWP